MLMTTASLVGLAFSPVLAGLVGASGLTVVFVVDVLLLVGLAILIASKLQPSPITHVEEEQPTGTL